jgi:hypothetical protein
MVFGFLFLLSYVADEDYKEHIFRVTCTSLGQCQGLEVTMVNISEKYQG